MQIGNLEMSLNFALENLKHWMSPKKVILLLLKSFLKYHMKIIIQFWCIIYTLLFRYILYYAVLHDNKIVSVVVVRGCNYGIISEL